MIGELLTTLPEGLQLGLTAYEYRQKGNCQDIKTIVMSGPDTRQAIMNAVNAISPKGKTPLSTAGIAAAVQLRYEEDKATAILKIDLNARDGADAPIIDADLVWTLTNQDGGVVVLENVLRAQILQELEEGAYFAEVLRSRDEAMAELGFVVGGSSKDITLIVPFAIPAATLEVVDTAVAGSTISVNWTGSSDQNDHITVAEIGNKDADYVNYTYTSEGAFLTLKMPPEPGTYELRYVMRQDKTVSPALQFRSRSNDL